jgi:hypothetical protein
MSCCIWVLVEVANLPLVDSDWQYLFLFKLIRMILIALDHHQPLVLVQSDFRGHEEDLRKKVLLLKDLFVVGLLQLGTLVHLETIIITALAAAEHPPKQRI